jgi:phospholipid transport system substrate-binding protein
MVNLLTLRTASFARALLLFIAVGCGWPAWSITQPAAVASPAGQEAAPTEAVVERFHQALIEALQLAEHSLREAHLQPRIAQAFDVRRISAISLGRTWRTLTDEQQTAFIELLTALITATYADRFDGFSGQQFVTDGVDPVKSGFIVRTRLTRSNAEDVSLHYFLRSGRIFNVVADGVSDLSLRRADYNSIIKNQGYEALLTHIADKIKLARSEQ